MPRVVYVPRRSHRLHDAGLVQNQGQNKFLSQKHVSFLQHIYFGKYDGTFYPACRIVRWQSELPGTAKTETSLSLSGLGGPPSLSPPQLSRGQRQSLNARVNDNDHDEMCDKLDRAFGPIFFDRDPPSPDHSSSEWLWRNV